MPARIVLTCWGSYGDLFPYLGLGSLLKASGHVVVLATCPAYRRVVEREGLEFRPVRPDVDLLDARLVGRLLDPARGTAIILRDILMPALRDAYADLDEAVDGADLLVTHIATYAAPLVADKRRLPWVSTVLAPASLFSVHDFPVVFPPQITRLARLGRWPAQALLTMAHRVTHSWAVELRRLRTELGLPPADSPFFAGQFSPRGTLGLFSSVLARPQPDWPPRTQATGFVFHDRVPDGLTTALEEAERFLDAGEPPIVFTLGSSAVAAPGPFFDESVKAAAAIGRRAMLLVGSQADRRQTESLPPDVIAVPYAPHHRVFPRAAAVVHHGGAGTNGQALRSGRPMLVVPHAHDQLDNADRIRRLGVGRVLPAGRYAAARVAAHLDALLASSRYRDRASTIGETVRAEAGVEAAGAAIMRALP